MSWTTFHHRGEILRDVVDATNTRLDGIVPMDVPGVAANFENELDLIGALVLKWNARLAGNIERALAEEPDDLRAAVVAAWQTTSVELPGLRMVIDHYTDAPLSAEMDRAMTRSRNWELGRLAAAAGLASGHGPAAVRVGRTLETQARAGLDSPELSVPETHLVPAAGAPSFVERIRAVLAA